MVGLGQHTRKPLQIWVVDGVLALNGGDEIVDELMLLPGALPRLPLRWSRSS